MSGEPAQGSGPPGGRAWQGDRLLQAIADRLSRSATIALLVSPAGLLFVSAARLLIISDYNPATASGIVSSGGYVDSLLGTILPLIPIFLPYLALVLLLFNRVIVGSLALLATLLISPMSLSRPAAANFVYEEGQHIANANIFFRFVLLIAALAVAALLLAVLLGVGFNAFMRAIATIVGLVLIPTFSHLYPLPGSNGYYTQLLRQPWLPAETITLSSGQKFTGYALADDGTWMAILKNSNRTISYYPASDVTGRQICRVGPQRLGQPAVRLRSSGPPIGSRAPACETSPEKLIPPVPATPAPVTSVGSPTAHGPA
jgi:hypothetical protein